MNSAKADDEMSDNDSFLLNDDVRKATVQSNRKTAVCKQSSHDLRFQNVLTRFLCCEDTEAEERHVATHSVLLQRCTYAK